MKAPVPEAVVSVPDGNPEEYKAAEVDVDLVDPALLL